MSITTQEPLMINPSSITISVNDREFIISGMNDEFSQQWTTSRLMSYWRNLVISRQIKAKISEVGISSDKENERDEFLNRLSGEWITLNNVLVAQALRITDPLEAEFVKNLDFIGKNQILSIQDKLNGLDILNELAKVDNALRTSQIMQEAIEKAALEQKEEEISRPRKLSKKIGKKTKKKAKK